MLQNLVLHYELYPVKYKKTTTFLAFPWVETSTGPGGFMICVFII